MKTVMPALLLMLVVSGCTTQSSNSGDTFVGFLDVSVRLEAPTPPNPRGDFDIRTTDVTKDNIGKDLSIRLIATAADSRYGVTKITIESGLSWRCSAGPGSQIIGTVQTQELSFTPFNQPPDARSPWQINVVAAPMSQISQAGCDMSSPGKGPIDITGFVRVVAQNSLQEEVTSKTFIFSYGDIGARQ
jgi:hypothetical protein